jgi:hypothetical protein
MPTDPVDENELAIRTVANMNQHYRATGMHRESPADRGVGDASDIPLATSSRDSNIMNQCTTGLTGIWVDISQRRWPRSVSTWDRIHQTFLTKDRAPATLILLAGVLLIVWLTSSDSSSSSYDIEQRRACIGRLDSPQEVAALRQDLNALRVIHDRVASRFA